MTFDQWWKRFSGNDVCDNYEETKSAWDAGLNEGVDRSLKDFEDTCDWNYHFNDDGDPEEIAERILNDI